MAVDHAAFAATLGFALDDFQRRALDAVDRGETVLVAAPTGSGKTVVGEYALHCALDAGTKAFYTTPLKALSNQKYLDFVERFGADSVGLLTGDNSIRGDAPLVVMTTEVLRNMLYARSPTLAGLRYVILDEVHYLENVWRGPVWEEVIIHAPPDVQLVCLSATVSNADEVVAWLRSVRGTGTAVVEKRRPVELMQRYLIGDRNSRRLTLVPMFARGRPNPRATEVRRPQTPGVVSVVEVLEDEGMLPAITFVFSRAGCEEAVRACRRADLSLTTPDEREAIAAIAGRRTAVLSSGDREVLGYDTWLESLCNGVGAHHAGLVPPYKEAVELAFAAGLVKVVFATETLALGVNMPARSVVITSLTKFTGEQHEMLRPAEYTQLTGRAGRRGIDEVGYTVVLYSRYVPFPQVAGLASRTTYDLTSAFRPTFNMAANLVRRYTPDEAHHVLAQSFAQFQSPKHRLTGEFDRILQLLEAWGYVEGWALSEAGERLAGLSHECDLLIAEAVRRGLLDELDPATVAGLVSTFTYETRGPEGTGPAPWFPSRQARARFHAIDALAAELNKAEHKHRLRLTRRPDPGFVALAHAWAAGGELAPVIADEDIAPGDFVRIIRQLVDLLRQLAAITPPATGDACRQAADALFRGVVSASNLELV